MSSFRILIVDDHLEWRRMLRIIFQEQAHWQVIDEASDGAEAIQKSRELQPDLILLDIGLPRLNGIEAARRICAMASHPRILFLSENTEVDVIREALNTGANGYVLKSEAAAELLVAMEVVRQGSRFVSGRISEELRT